MYSVQKKAIVVNFNNPMMEANIIKRESKYALIFAVCAMFSVLPFSAAAVTSSTANSNTQISDNVATADTGSYGLKIGDNGNKVVELQQWLKNQGYYVGAIDGDFGPYTELAVKYFQADAGIVVDGWVADQTVNAMNNLGSTFTLSGTQTTTTSQATDSQTATASQDTTSKTLSSASDQATTTSQATTSKATTSKATTASKSTHVSSSSSLSSIVASGTKYRYSKNFDCWAMSDYLYGQMTAAGIPSRIVQYGTSYSPNHRSVQVYQNGAWTDISYAGYDKMYKATSSKPGMTVVASN